jgi:hypothetical protein
MIPQQKQQQQQQQQQQRQQQHGAGNYVKMMSCGCPFTPAQQQQQQQLVQGMIEHQRTLQQQQQQQQQQQYHHYHGLMWPHCPPPLHAPPILSSGQSNFWCKSYKTFFSFLADFYT